MICDYCGGDRVLGVLEVWPDERAFMLETCCEGYHQAMLAELGDEELHRDPVWFRGFAAWLLEEAGLEARTLYVEDDGLIRIDWGLELRPISIADAKAWVREHHRHNAPPAGWRWGHAVFNGPDLVGVAMVGRPVARRIDHREVVEVNRVCIDPRLPAGLVWNAASMLYGAAAREAKRRGFRRIITYTLEGELGTTLKAAGWLEDGQTKGGSWNRPSRARKDTAPTCRKIRWARELQKARRRPQAAAPRRETQGPGLQASAPSPRPSHGLQSPRKKTRLEEQIPLDFSQPAA